MDEREWTGRSVFHEEKDFTEQTTEALRDAEQFVSSAKIPEAVERLLVMEKQTRLGNDAKSSMRIARQLVDILVTAGEWEMLMENVEALSKKRAQMKQVISVLVEDSMKALKMTKTRDARVALIQKLRSITEGKIHVELEYARLTKELAEILDGEGKLDEAAELMQGLQVETIGNMNREEKFNIILMQIEMSLRKKDYTIAYIITKKVPHRTIEKHETLPQRIRFFQLLHQYYEHLDNYFMMGYCSLKIYEAVYKDEFKSEDIGDKFATSEEKLGALQRLVVELILSPNTAKPETEEQETADRERERKEKEKAAEDEKNQTDAQKKKKKPKRVQKGPINIDESDRMKLLQRFRTEKRMDDLTDLRRVVTQLCESEIIHWPTFAANYQSLQNLAPFQDKPERWQIFQKRVNEHNVLVIAKYYTRISMPRLAGMLGMNEADMEPFVCSMVNDRQIAAKIDRVALQVDFRRTRPRAEVLNDWSDGVNKVLDLLGNTCHLIQKEYMVHGKK